METTAMKPFLTDAERWEALKQRDQQANGAFLYAVKTTGVYCRPVCSSRLPNRNNVTFFQTCDAAEQAGFRPCKRCKPNTASPREQQVQVIAQICKMIEESEESFSLNDLAIVAGLSQYHFHRLFKEIVGVTPKEYMMAQRSERVRSGLQQSPSVTQTIYDAGFGASSRFYESATSMLGMEPTQYKRGAAGIKIRYAIAQSTLGWVLVAATEKGICGIDFGETPEALTERLQARFPKAQLQGDDPTFAAWVEQVTAFIETPQRGLNLPLDIQGTAFQQRVWKALQEIPPGTTLSYAEVAERIGSPTAARAIARACASNQIAIAVPCHRVVRSNGDLSGYRWGVNRKQALLDREMAERGTAN